MASPIMNATEVAAQYPASYLAEYNGYIMIDTAIAFMVIQTVFLVLRFIARRLARVSFGVDDLLVVLGYLINIGVDAISIAMITQGGAGVHQVVANLHPEKVVIWVKLRLAVSIIYLPAVVLPKLAVLMIYHRVFQTPFVRRSCWVIGFILVGNLIGSMIAQGFGCRPISLLWDHTQHGTCLDIIALYEWSSFPNIVTDIMMLILPLPSIWRLQLSRNAKIGLSFTFLTASIGIVASCIRFVEFARISSVSDGTYAADLMVWTMVECGTYLMAACLCTLRPLIEKARKATTGRSYRLSSLDKGRTGVSKTVSVVIDKRNPGDDFAGLKQYSLSEPDSDGGKD